MLCYLIISDRFQKIFGYSKCASLKISFYFNFEFNKSWKIIYHDHLLVDVKHSIFLFTINAPW